MLKIIRSGFSEEGKEIAKGEILRLVTNKKKALMIVPEQQTVLSEIELAATLPSYAPLYFEVTNFTRLANTTFRSLGGIYGDYCDNSKKALLMWRTLTELSPVLDMTGRGRAISMGLVESALRAVGELQSMAISPDALSQVMADEKIKSDKRLFSKLSDILKIYTLYKNLLSEKYSDSGDDCQAMTEKLKDNPDFLSGYSIYVDGFTSFTEPQYALLGVLAKRAELTVILAVAKHTEDFFEMSEVKETKERLISVAKRQQTIVKLSDAPAVSQGSIESIHLLIDRLWRKNSIFDNITLQNSEEIRIFEATTPFDECDFIASDIKRRVMGGASYRDFAIISRSEEKYFGILDGALKLAKIPFFSSGKKSAEEYEIIKLIYSAYSAIRSKFSKEDVLTYAKCGLTGISRRECDLFECYVDTWQLTGSRFTDEIAWNMNPDGYNARRSSSSDETLVLINKTREALISPLTDLKARAEEAKTVTEQATVLLTFLRRLGVEKALSERAKRLAALTEHALAEENSKLWKLICDSLDTLTEVMGECDCTTDAFVDQLKILFSAASMGKIPAFYDEVTVGSADQLRLSGKKHIYLVGVNEGEFPAVPSDGSYFSDKDKEALSLAGLSVRPELDTHSAREMYIFQRALSYAKESVTLLYSASSARFKAAEPSEPIKRIVALTGEAVKPRRISDLSVKERIFVAESALEAGRESEAVRRALIESGHSTALEVSEGKIRNTDFSLGEALAKDTEGREMSLSQSKIDSYVNCPLAYFCKYTVGLSPEKRAEFDASGVGTLVHAILENFFRALADNNMSAKDISPEERIELTRRAAKKYISELGEDVSESSTRTKIKIERLCRAALPVVDGLCDEFSVSEFMPRFFELSINDDDPTTPDPIRISTSGGEKIVISGIIDRVDTLCEDGNVYVRVVDYKTGRKEFSPSDLSEGKNLQMFLYLKAIVETENEQFKSNLGVGEGGRIIPAGALYLKTFVGDKNIPTPDDQLAISAVKEEQKRLGMLLDDERIILKMGLKYTPLYAEKAKGTSIIPDSKRDLVFSEEGFSELMRTVEDSVIRVADSIRSGNAAADPKVEKDSSPCDFCDFKPVCRRVLKSKRML